MSISFPPKHIFSDTYRASMTSNTDSDFEYSVYKRSGSLIGTFSTLKATSGEMSIVPNTKFPINNYPLQDFRDILSIGQSSQSHPSGLHNNNINSDIVYSTKLAANEDSEALSDAEIFVSAGLFFQKNKIFLARRKFGNNSGMWEIPGGKIEQHENPAACLKREIHEELAIEIAQATLFHINKHKYKEFNICLYTFLIPATTIDWSEFRLKDHDACQWTSAAEALKKMKIAPADIPVLENYKNFYEGDQQCSQQR